MLPLLQVTFALLLLGRSGGPEKPAPTSRLICLGLNAPAMLFIYADPTLWGESVDVLPRSIGGRETADLFFLAGVAVVWYLVGRAIDRKLLRNREPAPARDARKPYLFLAFLLAVGVYLLLLAMGELERPRFGGRYRATLSLIWAGSLIALSGWGLMKPMLQKRQRIGGQVQS